ncbi:MULTISPECIES: helix-turn-helix domain-containing protein [Proteus]|uniref:Helix-turn-helix domain protein n=2 Tax=Proteus penneri TaxID=102862 RepID=A0A0G4QI89_9GAMM|nr:MULTISPECIES: helix-turn-helix transcriptional regulator [Proteus]NBL77760.1 helix-turn-helix domain-containing protein [Proteus sp. G2672]NBL89744.1 helix-turn-helix domain-containing protein [Proteus sp. G2673]NBM03049.1 helix-turn-helix domain-containing protein [Proteus sp. G2671]NBM11816.1 helix-turn-helix domain-containing protein [Proteus sp. G2670]NBM31958.1 helix-turn-helix domain-containing protein [Proteus sp. G2664]NBM50122.1 helix-turn-helix domain-containing protein [Proteus 
MINRYPVSKAIGRKITYYRKMKGISLDELAALIGVSQQQQSRYERGVNRINLDRLNQYAEIFNIHIKDFFILDEKDDYEIKTILLKKSEAKNGKYNN